MEIKYQNGLDFWTFSYNEYADYIQITEKLACGKLKWLPTHIERRKEDREKEGFILVEEETRKIYDLPNFLYGVVLEFRKNK